MDQNRPQSNPGYSGSSKEYVPQVGNLSQSIRSTSSGTYKGYHDINLLRSLLEQIINDTSNIMNAAESKLEKLNLQVSDASLQNAQKTEWPSDLGEPKDYVSFHQYQAFKQFDTRGSNFISKAYEDTVRGVAGNPALDVYIISGHIKDEALSIKGFLDDFIGSIDDTAEFRILEAFQDWAFMALKYARVFGSFIEARAEVQQAIPEAELEKLTQDQAKSFQVLFKTKVNGYNDEISKTLESLKTQFAHTDDFFTKFLGPSLKFRLNFQGDLSKTQSTGFFGSQAQNASRQMQGNIEAAVTDLVRRNDFFGKRFNELETRLKARSSYVQFVKDLEPTGARLKNPFVDVQPDPEEKQAFKSLATQKVTEKTQKNPFYSSHFDLADLDSVDAHPQYLLRSGGNLTGDITVDDGVKIDGVDIGEHRHKGKDVDGTHKIDGSDIVSGTLTSDIVKTDEAVCTPKGLRLLTTKSTVVPPGVASVNAQIAWDTCNSGLMYELQIVPVGNPGDASGGVVGSIPWYVDTLLDVNGRLGNNLPLPIDNLDAKLLITPIYPGSSVRQSNGVELDDGRVLVVWVEQYYLGPMYLCYGFLNNGVDAFLFGSDQVEDKHVLIEVPFGRSITGNVCRGPDGAIWFALALDATKVQATWHNESLMPKPPTTGGFGSFFYKSTNEAQSFSFVCELPWSSLLGIQPDSGLGGFGSFSPIIESNGRWLVSGNSWGGFVINNNVAGSSIYTSDDHGLTWTSRYTYANFNGGTLWPGLVKVGNGHIHASLVPTSLPGAPGGLFHSTDNGTTWTFTDTTYAGSGHALEGYGTLTKWFNASNPNTPLYGVFKPVVSLGARYNWVWSTTSLEPNSLNGAGGDWTLLRNNWNSSSSYGTAPFAANPLIEFSNYWLLFDGSNAHGIPKAEVVSEIAALASGKDYVVFAAVNNSNYDPPLGLAVYTYKWDDGSLTRVSGSLFKQYPDIPFKSISDVTQDFSNDDIYVADSALFRISRISNAYSGESAVTTNILDFSSVTDIHSIDAIDVVTGNDSPCKIYVLVTCKKYDNDLAEYVYQYSIYRCTYSAGVWTKNVVPGSQSGWGQKSGDDLAVISDDLIFITTKDTTGYAKPFYLYEFKNSSYNSIPQNLPTGGSELWFIKSISARPDGKLYVAYDYFYA